MPLATTQHGEAKALPQDVSGWLAHLEALHADVIELGLARVQGVIQQMALKPACPVIMVAGTNGKGSTCAMLERIYSAAGYKVGVYSSPHLLRYHERVRLNVQPIDDAALCASFAAVEQGRGQVALTYFEFGTLAAVAAFMAAAVDVMILEVGLGGRLDAVNAFEPDASIITSIDLDHQALLGDTRELIGFEKAGIYRSGKPAICTDPDIPASIVEHARTIGAHWLPLQRESGVDGFGYRRMENQWECWCEGRAFHSLPIPALRGSYQLANAAAALAAITQLNARLPVSMGAVRRGLLEVELPGRFQVLPGRPAVVLDVGHNPHAARALVQNLSQMGYFERTFAICGMMQDKDQLAVLQAMQPQVDHWLFCDLPPPRGAKAETLQALASQSSGKASVFTSPEAAWQFAQREAGERDRIVVFGSFVTVGAVLQARDKAAVH
ncbi:bifunctional tetrahydrofolate synthase/dihydrofolate synthase [Leeia sp.]|uniref:bifunctional tetrahydrofolate synthase/dihydrofolate synthase n=1 Tax=Leeia sp. TaxID=2884678 RepID=UPI0035AE4312